MNTNDAGRPRDLLIATTNPGKVRELAALLEGSSYRLISLRDLPQPLPVVEETGTTFAENALLKADYYHSQTGTLTIADDSGLEVDALGGRPGVYSARYGGEGLGDADKIRLLLEELKDTPEEKRTARFVCVIALVGGSERRIFEGRCEGRIAFVPRGSGGFGYDPVFIDPELGRAFAELSDAEKSARSHRGKALEKTRAYLESVPPSKG
jgi:XTP/dITP diphosphohydrolase